MKYKIEILKGIPPGAIIERDLKERKISRKEFAEMINVTPSQITEIIKGTRKLNLSMSLKIEAILGYEAGFLMTLQIHYEIKKLQASQNTPDLSKLSPALFWDTNLEKIDWLKNKRAVIERVSAYGTESEKQTILNFYGKEEFEKYSIQPTNAYRISYLQTAHNK